MECWSLLWFKKKIMNYQSILLTNPGQVSVLRLQCSLRCRASEKEPLTAAIIMAFCFSSQFIPKQKWSSHQKMSSFCSEDFLSDLLLTTSLWFNWSTSFLIFQKQHQMESGSRIRTVYWLNQLGLKWNRKTQLIRIDHDFIFKGNWNLSLIDCSCGRAK